MDPALQLRQAIEAGDAGEVLSLLDEHPELIKSRTGEAATPLHVAALHDRGHIVEQLLARGADVEARTTWGGTPLQCALICGHEDTAGILAGRAITPMTLRTLAGLGLVDLLEACFGERGELKPGFGAERAASRQGGGWTVEPPPNDAQTILDDALEYAARNGRVDAAKRLIQRGASVNGRGFFGATPLHWAIANGKLAMVEMLIEYGADLTLRDTTFNSPPLDWAREFKREAIAALLDRQVKRRRD